MTESTHLINFPYQYDPNAAFSPLPNEQSSTQDLDLNKHPSFFKHRFASGAEPVRLEVNGRKGRRVVCVLYGDRSRYSVFDLDTPSGEGEGEDEDDVEVYEDAENGDEDQIMEDGS